MAEPATGIDPSHAARLAVAVQEWSDGGGVNVDIDLGVGLGGGAVGFGIVLQQWLE